MHKHDIALFSAMQTITLRQFTTLNKTKFPNDRAFAKFIVKEVKRLKTMKTIDNATFKYFLRTIVPQSANASTRWKQQFRRYSQILVNLRDFEHETDCVRLQAFLNSLSEKGFVSQYGHPADLAFTEDESTTLLKHGFVGIPADQLNKIKNDTFPDDLILTYYLPKKARSIELTFISTLQDFGFNIYLPLERAEARLIEGSFAQVSIVSFAKKLI